MRCGYLTAMSARVTVAVDEGGAVAIKTASSAD
jgi:hypothetical protein